MDRRKFLRHASLGVGAGLTLPNLFLNKTFAATGENDNALFLALVATMPNDMRRGFGEAVTRKAIHEGIRRTGRRHVVLHATPAGRPVYERIGYRTNSPIHFIQLTQP